MLYNCGGIEGYNYILDSETGTCRLVKNGSFDENSINRGSLSPAKLKMLYGFVDSNFGLDKDLCTYEVEFNNNYSADIQLCIGIVNISSSFVKFRNANDISKYLKNFLYGQYCIFLLVRSIHSLVFTPNFWQIRLWAYLYYCLPLPVQMLDCLFGFVRSYDFDGLNSIFGGALIDTLTLRIDGNIVRSHIESTKNNVIGWYN